MKYIKIYEVFRPPFKSFNPYVSEIMKRLDSIYVKDNIVISIVDKNSGKLDIVGYDKDDKEIDRMMVQVRYVDGKIKIMIYRYMLKKFEYLKHLCDIYCEEVELDGVGLRAKFIAYFLYLDKFDKFIENLTPESEEVYNISKKYNL